MPVPPLHFLDCIAAAHRTGFLRYAAALHTLFAMEYPTAPKFTTVTGRDFGRVIAWAKAQPPGPLSNAGLRAAVSAARSSAGGHEAAENSGHVPAGQQAGTGHDAVREHKARATRPAPCSESTKLSASK